jgi:hypothetical protein
VDRELEQEQLTETKMDEEKQREIIRLLGEANKALEIAVGLTERLQKKELLRWDWTDSFVPRHRPEDYSLQVKKYNRKK